MFETDVSICLIDKDWVSTITANTYSTLVSHIHCDLSDVTCGETKVTII